MAPLRAVGGEIVAQPLRNTIQKLPSLPLSSDIAPSGLFLTSHLFNQFSVHALQTSISNNMRHFLLKILATASIIQSTNARCTPSTSTSCNQLEKRNPGSASAAFGGVPPRGAPPTEDAYRWFQAAASKTEPDDNDRAQIIKTANWLLEFKNYERTLDPNKAYMNPAQRVLKEKFNNEFRFQKKDISRKPFPNHSVKRAIMDQNPTVTEKEVAENMVLILMAMQLDIDSANPQFPGLYSLDPAVYQIVRGFFEENSAEIEESDKEGLGGVRAVLAIRQAEIARDLVISKAERAPGESYAVASLKELVKQDEAHHRVRIDWGELKQKLGIAQVGQSPSTGSTSMREGQEEESEC